MNNIKILFVLIGVFCFSVLASAQEMTFEEAVNKKMIRYSIESKGCYNGPCLRVSVTNLTDREVSIVFEPGLAFICMDEGAQDLLVVKSHKMTISKKSKLSDSLTTMCLENFNYSPPKGALFVPDTKMKYANLKKVAHFINQHTVFNSLGQVAVWCTSGSLGLGSIVSDDTTTAFALQKLVSEITGKQIPPPPKKPVPPFILSCRINMIHHFVSPKIVSLGVYDSSGKELVSYYKNKIVTKGVFIATVGFNTVCEEGTKFYIRTKDEKGRVLMERMVYKEEMEDVAKQYAQEIKFSYQLKKPLQQGALKLFDAKGNLMDILWENRDLPEGYRDQSYSFEHGYGKKAIFYIRMFNDKEKIIYEYKFDGSTAKEVPRKAI